MNFIFHVNISENDYLDYNIFWQLKSPYGKNQILFFRIFLAVIVLAGAFISLRGNYSIDSFLGVTPILLVGIIFELLLNRLFYHVLKSHIKGLSKKGKMGYSSTSVMEFNEDGFAETTQENKTEQKYSAIERISIVNDKMIYIHTNNIMAYILPLSCFESKEQYDAFLNFIRTKCHTIDIY